MVLQGRALAISGRFGQLEIGRQLLINILVVAGCSVGVKAAGMLRDVVLASRFGTSDAADAFIAAWAIPQFLAMIIGGAFAGVLIPLQAEAHRKGGDDHARGFLGELLLIGTVVLAIATLLLIPFRSPLLSLVTLSFGPAKLAETHDLWLVMLPAVFLYGVSIIWSAMLNTGDRFGLAAFAPILVPVCTIAALWIYPAGGITAPAVGFVIGNLAQVAWLLGGVRRSGLAMFPAWRGGLPETRLAMRQFLPYVANGAVFGGIGVVDQAMAATLGQGSLAQLNYANKLVMPVLAIGSAALATVVYPRFARLVADRDWRRVRHQAGTWLGLTLAASIPVAIALIALSPFLVELLFERGQFTAADTRAVARVQAIYALMIPAYTVSLLLSRVLNAMRATRYVLIGSIVVFAFNVIADYLFKEWLGIKGIALATVGNYVLALCFNGYFLHRLIRARLSGEV